MGKGFFNASKPKYIKTVSFVGCKDANEKELKRNKAIIQSMTPYERQTPNAIKGGQRKRIASGSGTSIQDVNKLLKQFENAKNSNARINFWCPSGMIPVNFQEIN